MVKADAGHDDCQRRQNTLINWLISISRRASIYLFWKCYFRCRFPKNETSEKRKTNSIFVWICKVSCCWSQLPADEEVHCSVPGNNKGDMLKLFLVACCYLSLLDMLRWFHVVLCRRSRHTGSPAVDPLHIQVGWLLQQIRLRLPAVRQQRRNYVQRQHTHDAVRRQLVSTIFITYISYHIILYVM